MWDDIPRIIKLIRTDTTLDLTQKAEKDMLCMVSWSSFYIMSAALFVSLLVNVGHKV